ncbi:hypothetical protein EYF80_055257 [Liparis tanakae]|uniref:Uncharacterized protein n=1 Tax=Liparis tanakae TaxID=230148 RepID=A0A4Z2F274_9TELE|nr:hypothetical protein EYF80_055257 [Liparis tanakae]
MRCTVKRQVLRARCGVLPPLPVPLRPDIPPSSSPGGVEKRRLPFSEECSDEEAKGDCLESPKFRKGSLSCREAA